MTQKWHSRAKNGSNSLKKVFRNRLKLDQNTNLVNTFDNDKPKLKKRKNQYLGPYNH